MRAVHRFLEGDLAVAVAVDLAVVPDDGRVRDSARAKSPSFSTTACTRLCGIGVLGSAALNASSGLTSRRRLLGRVDAPQVADALAVLGVLADGDVDQAVVNHRRADEVVAGALAHELELGVLRIGSNFHSSLALAVVVALGVEAVEPAVAAAEDHLRLAVDLGVGRATTTGRAGCSCPGELSVHSTLPVFLSIAKKLGASGAGT